MSGSTPLRIISAAEILQPSPRFPVTLQDETMPVLDGLMFSSDEDAVWFKATERPDWLGKVEVPLELPMQAAFRPENPESKSRVDEDFRIVLADREVAPFRDEGCAVMPYVLFNGITSVVLRVVKPEDKTLFQFDSFWLNVFEPGVTQPFSGVSDAMLQVILKPNKQPATEVLDRYRVLKEKAGYILQRIINTPVETVSTSE